MDAVALRLIGLIVLLLPLAIASWLVWRRFWVAARSSEALLAGLIAVPFLIILEIAALNAVPVERPLQHLLIVQIVVSGMALSVCVLMRRVLAESAVALLAGARAGWSASTVSERAILLLGLLVQTAAILYGTWHTPWTVDELAYHIPQAVQPYHDGRLGPVRANVVWADSYPRGVALLYYWTLQLSHTDAGFHPVNGTMGAVVLLAVYAAGRRLGLPRPACLVAVGIVPTAPIVWLLGTSGYIDLSVAAAVAAALAFAISSPSDDWIPARGIALLIPSVLALWMKFTALGVVGFIWTFLLLAAAFRALRARQRLEYARQRRHLVWLLAIAVAAGSLASIPYVRTWHTYGSPVYPVRLTAGSQVIFDGPMTATDFIPLTDRPLTRRYAEYWTNWFLPLTTDSPGSYGPLFTLVMLAAVSCCLVWSVLARQHGWLLITTTFALVCFLPGHHTPRYGVWVLVPGALCTARLGVWLADTHAARIWRMVVILLALSNLYPVVADLCTTLTWQRGFGLPLLTAARDRVIADQVEHSHNRVNSETRRTLYERVGDGELVVSAVPGIFGYLYDYRYRYRVEHRPASEWPYAFDPCRTLDHGASRAEEWYAGILRDEAAIIIVTAGTVEDEILRERTDFALFHQQEGRDGHCAVRLYARGEAP
jgi:hypothetical protein